MDGLTWSILVAFGFGVVTGAVLIGLASIVFMAREAERTDQRFR